MTVAERRGNRVEPTSARQEVASLDQIPWDEVHTVPVVLVTGTVGTTATARLLARIARQAGHTVGLACSDGVEVGDSALTTDDPTGPGCRAPGLARFACHVRDSGDTGWTASSTTAWCCHGSRPPWSPASPATRPASMGVTTLQHLAEAALVVAKAARHLVLNADDPLLSEHEAGAWFSLDHRVEGAWVEDGELVCGDDKGEDPAASRPRPRRCRRPDDRHARCRRRGSRGGPALGGHRPGPRPPRRNTLVSLSIMHHHPSQEFMPRPNRSRWRVFWSVLLTLIVCSRSSWSASWPSPSPPSRTVSATGRSRSTAARGCSRTIARCRWRRSGTPSEVRLRGGRRVFGTGLPGFCAGRFSYDGLGSVWQVTDCRRDVLMLRVEGEPLPLLVTPPDHAAFLAALRDGRDGDFSPGPVATSAGGIVLKLLLFVVVLPSALFVPLASLLRPDEAPVPSGERRARGAAPGLPQALPTGRTHGAALHPHEGLEASRQQLARVTTPAPSRWTGSPPGSTPR